METHQFSNKNNHAYWLLLLKPKDSKPWYILKSDSIMPQSLKLPSFDIIAGLKVEVQNNISCENHRKEDI